ncbi:hypothetical protein AB0D49_26750 [Streptomyces sp. NPDC048290]|uniref:hypothetical protein n=1 Tax=Streptomyces sp. NPDC048290 TaxID=3155811 RepID=UPI003448E8FC
MKVTRPPSAAPLVTGELSPPPVPGARTGGLARDRMRLWRAYGDRYRAAMAALGQVGDGATDLDGRVGARADLAALRLYLGGEWAWAEPALHEGGTVARLPLTRCAAAALRRLPPYRGAAIVRTPVPASLASRFMDQAVVTDPGLWCALVSRADLGAGGPGYAVWSSTGRLMGEVDPYTPDRLVFAPGTRFKVLDVRGGRTPLVLLRDMSPSEPLTPAAGGDSPDEWLDRTAVAQLRTALEQSSAPTVTPFPGPRARPPGPLGGPSQ